MNYSSVKFINMLLPLFAATALLLIPFAVHSQSSSSLLKEVMHQSPNVSTLGKFGEVPVGYYTGVPNISIPIYEINSGPLSLPISLNYHAGGVRVEEVASNVGLSWALQAGGIITRSVRGIPDYDGLWYNLPQQHHIESYKNNRPSFFDDFLLEVEMGHSDSEADIFSFSFGGKSGKFILDQNGLDIHLLTKSNLAISRYQTGWKIVDETGTTYLFLKVERQITVETDIEIAWVLTDITSSDGKHNITLSYEHGSTNSLALLGETRYITQNAMEGCQQNVTGYTNVNNAIQRLTRIDSERDYMTFVYGAERCDILGDVKLDEIRLHKKDGTPIKKFFLTHSYFGDNPNCSSAEAHKKRLKLTSLREVTAIETKPPYVFTYDENAPFPSTLSYAQDHWGYYNGANNNTLIPGNISGVLRHFKGANRTTNPAKAQLGVLKSITYPTGGSTNFTYESNTSYESSLGPAAFHHEYLNFSFSQQNIPVADMPSQLSLVTPLIIPAGGAIIDQFSVTAPLTSCDILEIWVTKNGVPFLKLETGASSDLFNFTWDAGTYALSIEYDCPEAIMPPFNVNIRAIIPQQIEPNSSAIYVGGVTRKKNRRHSWRWRTPGYS